MAQAWAVDSAVVEHAESSEPSSPDVEGQDQLKMTSGRGNPWVAVALLCRDLLTLVVDVKDVGSAETLLR